MIISLVWDGAMSPVKAVSLAPHMRECVRNTLAPEKVIPWREDSYSQGIMLDVEELRLDIAVVLAGQLQSMYGIDAEIAIRMTVDECNAAHHKQFSLRFAVEQGISMLNATKSWFKDKRLQAIRRKLQEGLNPPRIPASRT
jgi:hypothetical protein